MSELPVSIQSRLRLFGAAVRAARQDRGWTQADLAYRVGAGIATIMKIESGFAGAAFGTILQLCSVLNLSPDPEQIAATPAQQRALTAAASRRKRVRKPAIDPALDV